LSMWCLIAILEDYNGKSFLILFSKIFIEASAINRNVRFWHQCTEMCCSWHERHSQRFYVTLSRLF